MHAANHAHCDGLGPKRPHTFLWPSLAKTLSDMYSGEWCTFVPNLGKLPSSRPISTIFSPFILTANLFLLFGSEVVCDVKRLPDFFRRFPLDHVGNSLAADIEKSFNVEVVCGLDPIISILSAGKRRGRKD